jgi:hypothetical protein
LHIDESEGRKPADNKSYSKPGRLTGEDTLVEAHGKIPGGYSKQNRLDEKD